MHLLTLVLLLHRGSVHEPQLASKVPCSTLRLVQSSRVYLHQILHTLATTPAAYTHCPWLGLLCLAIPEAVSPPALLTLDSPSTKLRILRVAWRTDYHGPSPREL